jgi:glycosyltransferase involved in cell wall biosynthesis
MTLSPGKSRPLVVLDALLVNEQPTGVGRSILELLGALAHRDRGCDFLVLATHPEMFGGLRRVPGWKMMDCPGARGGTLRKALFTQFQVPRICASLQADALHSLQFIAPMRLSCPSVVTVHDLAWIRFPETVEEPRRSYYRLFVPRTLERAAAIVTNSEATARDTAKFYPGTESRITATLFGTPSWVWRMDQQDKVEPAARPFFLFVGTLEPRKNLENLLAAYERFHAGEAARSRPEMEIPRLLFVGGKGWKDTRLRKKISAFSARGQLEVLDYCNTDDLWKLYRSARALLFPSLHEGFGFPILEAMAAGLPVLTSDRGAMAEVGGTEVLKADPEDIADLARAMEILAWDDQVCDRLAAAGPDRAREWSWDRTADLTARVYQQLTCARI